MGERNMRVGDTVEIDDRNIFPWAFKATIQEVKEFTCIVLDQDGDILEVKRDKIQEIDLS